MKRSKLSLPDWVAGAYGTPSVAKKGEGRRGEIRAKKIRGGGPAPFLSVRGRKKNLLDLSFLTGGWPEKSFRVR